MKVMVLMVAYMSGLKLTLESKKTHGFIVEVEMNYGIKG